MMTTEQKEIERDFWLMLAKRERKTIEEMQEEAIAWKQEGGVFARYGELARNEIVVHEAMEARYMLNAQV